MCLERSHLYGALEKTKPGMVVRDWLEGAKETFSGDRKVLYFECSDGYMGI